MTPIKNILRKIDRRLLPADLELGVLPYVWLVYLALFVSPIFFTPWDSKFILATLGTAVIFLALYFYTFWQTGKKALLCILGFVIIGMINAPLNPGASTFFVYAAAFCGHFESKQQAQRIVLAIAAVAAVYSMVLNLPWYFYMPATIITILVGMMNIYETEIRRKNKQLKISQEELRKAATTAERERIARDLHDVIGHTFSLINVKAQLAQKLVDKAPDKAKKEIKELEQISRNAMAEVRQTVSNYHEKDMGNEISKAKILAQSADIKLTSEVDDLPEKGPLNSALAFVIRELMTNIVKHSNATECQLQYRQKSGVHHLSISDNGKLSSASVKEGNGLRGIKERVEALQGDVAISTENGFGFSINIPE